MSHVACDEFDVFMPATFEQVSLTTQILTLCYILNHIDTLQLVLIIVLS